LSGGGTRVGIGTSNPTYELDVAGDIGVDQYIYHNGDADTYINFSDDDINIQAGGVNFIDITQDTVSEITFNEAGANVDFRVEGDTDVDLLFTDASTDRVGIGTAAPDQKLEVDGVIKQKVYTVGNLPTAGSSTIGSRAFVSDSAYAYSSSYVGYSASGGGSNFSPVYSDGSSWYMG